MKKPTKTPREARTEAAILALPRTVVETDEHWMLIDVDGAVTFKAQRNGEASTEQIELPRATFEAFVDWYQTGVWKKPRKSRAK